MTDRLRTIVDRLRIRPHQRILEIGCGHGVAASYIGALLQTGCLTAIDRSAKMIAAARRRNADLVAAGRAEFVVADFESWEPGASRFDVILAIRVAIFHRDRETAVARASRWLNPSGRIVVEYDTPPGALRRGS